LLATFARDDRQRSGIFSSPEKVLDVYADPKVAASAAGFDLDPVALLDGRATLFLVAPLHEQQRLAPLFVALVSSIVRAAQDRVAWTGRPLSPRLLLLLDEAANIAALPDLDHLASTVAGQGIQLVSVFQDMAQVQQRYGTHRAATVVNNHAATLALAGIKDPATLDHLSRLMGDEAVAERSRTSTGEGRSSTTEHTAYRRLAPLEELRTMRRGSGVLLYGNLPPARLRLRPWFADRRLRNLAAGISVGGSSTKVGLLGWLRTIRGGVA
jgi:type IV secretion system protein VirD4